MIRFGSLFFALLFIPLTAFAMSQGEYLAKVGDCTACHTAPEGKPFAGGYKIHTPFGTIYGTNITPDPQYGIGNYSLQDFSHALRDGVAKDGHHLYPAMPYPSFSKLTDDDIKSLYDYFMHEVKPVHQESPQSQLHFPFSQRWGIAFWNLVFNHQSFQQHKDRDKQWNRGAYLVQSLAHCSACHTPRGPAYEELGSSESSHLFLTGGLIDNWYAPSLRADNAAGLGRWSEEDISEFLHTGHGAGTQAYGGMADLVFNSGQYISADDRQAIAHYLKSLNSEGNEESHFVPNAPAKKFEQPGAGLYATFCSGCHQMNGTGKLPAIPALAGNSNVLSANPTSPIRIVLEGASLPQMPTHPSPVAMPGFGKRFTDQEIADVLNYLRSSWGNQAPPVTPQEVKSLRHLPKE